jgi:predicted nucleic acid-binding Zn ribbon protein
MARKSLGYVPLVWRCPSCETQNPGPIKSCTSCGAPQPPDVKFYLVEEDKFNFIKDEALIRMAQAGPDIHCPYCGTRNPSTAQVCSKCGGDLSHGGEARQAGQQVQTIPEAQEIPQTTPPMPIEEPIAPPRRISPIVPIIGILAIIACVIAMFMLFFKTDDVTATVTEVEWERIIVVEEYTTVTRSDWTDQIPGDADILSCSQQYRYTSDSPVPNATEVCGEIYYEDTGTGAGEALQDCTYQVYDDYCEYTTLAWTVVGRAVESGYDNRPYWPSVDLTASQRQGAQQESYVITLEGDDGRYQFTTTDSDLFYQAAPGTRWKLSVNQLGGIQSIEPAN